MWAGLRRIVVVGVEKDAVRHAARYAAFEADTTAAVDV
jgi:hypothetical protein